MGKLRKVSYKGKEFKSVADFARYYKKDPELVLGRINKGKTPHEAITLPYSNRVPICVAHTNFDSIAEACRKLGFRQKLVENRLRSGWSVDEAFEIIERSKPQVGSRAKSVKVHGRKYPSIKILAKEFGLTVSMIDRRVRILGMSYEQAVSFKKVREIKCYGKTYPSKAALARAYSMNVGTLVSRLSKGMSSEQAVSAPIQNYLHKQPGTIYIITNLITGMKYVGLTRSSIQSRLNSHFKSSKLGRGKEKSLHEAMRVFPKDAFTIEAIDFAEDSSKLQELEQYYISEYKTVYPNGYNQNIGGSVSGGVGKHRIRVRNRVFESFAEACRFFDIDEGTCMNRIKRGWNLEKSFTTPPENFDKSQSVIVKGITYDSLKEASKRNGADYKKVFYHVKYMKETPEKAILALAGKSRKVTVNGVEYPYLQDACKAYGVKVATVLYRKRVKGMTLEEAITSPKMKNGSG